MNVARLAPVAATLAAVFTLAAPVQAQSFGAHPALDRGAVAAVSRIDPNTFIVAHPAGLTWRAGHANHAHPADVLSHRQATIDPNHFLVQPPSSVHWVETPTVGTAIVAAAR